MPVDALREALVNALVHRDYLLSVNVQVHIYRSRVEIISPGGLPAVIWFVSHLDQARQG